MRVDVHTASSSRYGLSVRSSSQGQDKFAARMDGAVLSSSNSFGGFSDINLKQNITDAASQWNDIKNLKVRKFQFKSEPEKTLIGVVAQEVETVSPGLVDETPDAGDKVTLTKTVKYSVLYMKAIKALQEAQSRIETLESKVAALEG